MQNQRPSLFRVIGEDYVSLLSALFPLLFWIYSAYSLFVRDDSTQFFVLLSAAVTAVAIPLLLWRYRTIASVFEDGMEAPGTITAINFFRGRGRVSYVYTFQGQKYSSGNAINRTKHSKNLEVGKQVTIFIDPGNPKRAFVKEIYL